MTYLSMHIPCGLATLVFQEIICFYIYHKALMGYGQILFPKLGKKNSLQFSFCTVIIDGSTSVKTINTVFYAFSYRVAISPSSTYSCMHSTNILSKNIPLASGDTSCLLQDDQFSRQALAGINNLGIERLKVSTGFCH